MSPSRRTKPCTHRTAATGRVGRSRADAIVRAVIAVVFLCTAYLKVRPAWSTLSGAANGTEPDWGTIALANWEFLLGVWLASGLAPSMSRAVTIGTFGVFAAASAWKVFSGAQSCGCAGQIQVNPWYSLGFSFSAVGALLLAPGRRLDFGSSGATLPESHLSKEALT